MKNIAILGATGSIGCSTLEVVRNNPDRLSVRALTGGKNWQLLAKQALECHPDLVVIADKSAYGDLKNALSGSQIRVEAGDEAIVAAVEVQPLDAVVAAIVGSAGLSPVMAAIDKGLQICLANKETLVVGGSLVMQAVKRAGVDLLPVDSEHSAIFQCLQSAQTNPLHKIIITASGGPFRQFSSGQLAAVTPEQALKHPNWDMGGKITIDSSTLMNKGLEVIEAHWLFNAAYDNIEVVVHPQSIIHSLVEFSDGSVIAQLGWPDMKLPIQYALSWPTRWSPPLPPLDLAKVASMTFEPPDTTRFPCLAYAYEAGRAGGIMPCVLNAANEIAVAAFLRRQIGFMSIPAIIRKTMDSFSNKQVTTVGQLLEVDAQARETATSLLSAEVA
ncbi:MAG: 1-deoxy-D-xylulose-5-phosphate reductoisomerase [Candidatus Riflebacteria bacterium HGW-Riflebacteria-1]|jgi:1-deoxy-D-xylulose-5-phosphate reductoisomerase|nr:MAG: 1-deoxy-D-xylulose-5-phosphate reductoisomerase [Candidatus Riflebacteria bacterium HGW-Riflebacteria-1]